MDWKLHSKSDVYDGHFKVTEYRLSHRKFDGQTTPILTRELLGRDDAVALVPYDPVTDQVVLVEQFRVGAIREQRPWLIEVVAGLIEENENPEQVAVRESVEEIGCEPSDLLKIAEFYTSPGGLSEWIHLYIGRVDVTQLAGMGGLDEEDEDIKIHIVSASDIPLMVSTGEVRSAIAIIGLQWFINNREQLQKKWLEDVS